MMRVFILAAMILSVLLFSSCQCQDGFPSENNDSLTETDGTVDGDGVYTEEDFDFIIIGKTKFWEVMKVFKLEQYEVLVGGSRMHASFPLEGGDTLLIHYDPLDNIILSISLEKADGTIIDKSY